MHETTKPLLEKYDLHLEQLDYKFIENCKHVKTLERILIVLRSGEEGFYPDLVKYCENRLRLLAPNSRLLYCAQKLLNYSELPENERNEIEKDIDSWMNETNYEEAIKEGVTEVNRELPPVRGKSVKIDTKMKKEKTSHEKTSHVKTEKKPLVPRNYSEWEKFDVEEELKKLEENETSEVPKKPKKKIKKDSGLQKLVSVSDLSEKERQYVADLEKNKGNEAFKAHDYEEAVTYYTRSYSAFKSTVALNNRAQAYIKLKNYFAAVQDCTEVISMEPNNVKALYRRGVAYKESGVYELAKLDFMVLLELDPDNKFAKEQLEQIKHLRSAKPEKKKVVIEEIKSDETETAINEEDEENINGTCTRMKIEEVATTENTVKLTNINYSSSDEDDTTSQMSETVKQMLQINKPKKRQPLGEKDTNENEIEKRLICGTKQKEKKTKIVEECKVHLVKSNGQDKNTSEEGTFSQDKEACNKFVNVKIENYISDEGNLRKSKEDVAVCEKFNIDNPKYKVSATSKSTKVKISEIEHVSNEDNTLESKEYSIKNRDFKATDSNIIIINEDALTKAKHQLTEDFISNENTPQKSKEDTINYKELKTIHCQTINEKSKIDNPKCEISASNKSSKIKIAEIEQFSNDDNTLEFKGYSVKNNDFRATDSNIKIMNDHELMKAKHRLTENIPQKSEEYKIHHKECKTINNQTVSDDESVKAKHFEVADGISNGSNLKKCELTIEEQDKFASFERKIVNNGQTSIAKSSGTDNDLNKRMAEELDNKSHAKNYTFNANTENKHYSETHIYETCGESNNKFSNIEKKKFLSKEVEGQKSAGSRSLEIVPDGRTVDEKDLEISCLDTNKSQDFKNKMKADNHIISSTLEKKITNRSVSFSKIEAYDKSFNNFLTVEKRDNSSSADDSQKFVNYRERERQFKITNSTPENANDDKSIKYKNPETKYSDKCKNQTLVNNSLTENCILNTNTEKEISGEDKKTENLNAHHSDSNKPKELQNRRNFDNLIFSDTDEKAVNEKLIVRKTCDKLTDDYIKLEDYNSNENGEQTVICRKQNNTCMVISSDCQIVCKDFAKAKCCETKNLDTNKLENLENETKGRTAIPEKRLMVTLSAGDKSETKKQTANNIPIKSLKEAFSAKVDDKLVSDAFVHTTQHTSNENNNQKSQENRTEGKESKNINSPIKTVRSDNFTKTESPERILGVSLEKENQMVNYYSNSIWGNISTNQKTHEPNSEAHKENEKTPKLEIIKKETDYEEITPYEFLRTWCSNNVARDSKIGAEYLLKIKPEELPSIISNKIDASMLSDLLTSISIICKMGKTTEGESYLYYLKQVPRIKIAAMFLSNGETQSIHNLFSTLENEHTLLMKYVNKILQT